MATHARTATAGALQAPLFMQQQKKVWFGFAAYCFSSVLSPIDIRIMHVYFCLCQDSPHIHCALQYSMHDWKIDRALLRGFRRNGHLVFPVRDARLKVLFGGGQ